MWRTGFPGGRTVKRGGGGCKILAGGYLSVKIIILLPPTPKLFPDVQEPVPESSPSPPLPPDHVLYSGAVLFPGRCLSSHPPPPPLPLSVQDKLKVPHQAKFT